MYTIVLRRTNSPKIYCLRYVSLYFYPYTNTVLCASWSQVGILCSNLASVHFFSSMTFFLKIKTRTFSISKLVRDAIIQNKLNVHIISHGDKQIYYLDDSCLPLFKVIPPLSSTHFYIRIRYGVKLLVNRSLFDFVDYHTTHYQWDERRRLWSPENMGSGLKPITTPLSWIGNKSKVCSHIFSTIPKVIDNYYEPFLGSGSVLLYVLQQQLNGNVTIRNDIVVSDSNNHLINFFNVLQKNPGALISFYYHVLVSPFKRLKTTEARKEFFYGVRSDFNQNLYNHRHTDKQAARFLFLNKTSYGGLFRVNSKGFYNASFANKVPAFPTYDSLDYVSKLIGTAKIDFVSRKFAPLDGLMSSPIVGDFVYLDPPYVEEKKSSFQSSGFSKEDSLSLLPYCEWLTERGCFFSLSSSTKIASFSKDYRTIRYCSKPIKGKGNLDQFLITNSRE